MGFILVDLDSNKEIVPDTNGNIVIKRTFPAGVRCGEKFSFGSLVAPTEGNPKGLVRSKKEGLWWKEYYPEVFNAKIVECE